MRWIIPSYNRPTATTPKFCEALGLDWTLAVHNQQQADLYVRSGIPSKRIVVADVRQGIAPMRQWILTKWAQLNEWYVDLDDILTFERAKLIVDHESEMEVELTGRMLVDELSRTRDEAEKRGAHVAGFAVIDNTFYRKKQWQDVGTVCGKMHLVQRTDRVFHDESIRAMSQFSFTAEHLRVYGRTLVNQSVWVPKPHYAPGGIGTKEERAAPRSKDIPYILTKWPGLYREVLKDDGKLQDLRLRIYGLAQVAQWRERLESGQQSLL